MSGNAPDRRTAAAPPATLPEPAATPVPTPTRPAAPAVATARRRCCLGVAAACAAPSLVQPQPGGAEPPRPGPPRPLEIAVPTEDVLPNGLRGVLAERRGVQLATVSLVVLAGAETDPPGRAGLASLTAELLAKGSRRRDAGRLADDAESLGGLLDSGAGWHESSAGITVAVPRLDAALALLSEVVREPAFRHEEVARLRTQTLDELRVALDRPDRLAALGARRLLHGAGPYGHPVAGTPASIVRLTRADVVRQHAAYYRPDRAALILAGDLDAATARTLAERHFGAWRAPPPARAPTPRPAAPVAGSIAADTADGQADAIAAAERVSAALLVDLPRADQAAIVVGVPLPPLGADRATAEVANAVLGGGFSGRLNQAIRIRRGLSYGAGSGLDDLPLGGSLRATAQTRDASAAAVVTLIRAELDRLAREPVDAAELAARKAALIGDFARGVQTTAGLAAALQARLVAGLPPTTLAKHVDALLAVDAADVRRFAAAHLEPGRQRLVVAGAAARLLPVLRQVAPDLRVVAAQRLAAGRD